MLIIVDHKLSSNMLDWMKLLANSAKMTVIWNTTYTEIPTLECAHPMHESDIIIVHGAELTNDAKHVRSGR